MIYVKLSDNEMRPCGVAAVITTSLSNKKDYGTNN